MGSLVLSYWMNALMEDAMNDTTDRRINTRFAQKGSIALTCLSSPGNLDLEHRTIHCITGDVSFGGVNFRSYRHVPAGSTVELTYQAFDSDKTLRRRGEVAWSKDEQEDIIVSHSVGVRFAPDNSSDRDAWRSMIEKFIIEAPVSMS